MASAGDIAEAGRIPGQRIATTIETSDSSDFTTTETTGLSVTAALVEGRTYGVTVSANWSSTADGDVMFLRIWAGSTSGTQLHSSRLVLEQGAGPRSHVYVEWEATSTGNQTFIVTGERESGSGTLHMDAAGTIPGYLFVDYISG